MRKDIKKAIDTLAEVMPGIISGIQLEFFTKMKVTSSQLITLIALSYMGRTSVTNLTMHLHVSMPTVSGLIDRLVKLKMVKRIPSKEDRRKVYLELTKNGKTITEAHSSIAKERWVDILSLLTPKEVSAYQNVLDKINYHFRKHKQQHNLV